MTGSRSGCIAVIPARGGSKRIPKKNVRHMLGKPLLAYTLAAAVDSGLFDRVIVSTDSPEIAEVARLHGGETPFLRNAHLADDFVPVSAVTADVISQLDPTGVLFHSVCQLMPNCPLRTAGDILDSHRQFVETNAELQISVTRYGWQNPWWAMRQDQEFVLEPLFESQVAMRSQDLPELYCPTGAAWWAKANALRREGTFHAPGRKGWEISWTHGLDIDTEDDWLLAEVLLRLGEPIRS